MLSGAITLNSSTDSIVASDVQWGGSFSTGGNGSITLSNSTLDQQTLLKTDSGAINFQRTIQPGANVQFESGSGAITIALPTSTTFQLDFGSNTVGSGRPANLQITTDSGPAFIKKQ